MPADYPTTVSVVIVNYNSGQYLGRCLRSLMRSSVSLEICVVDNASSDGSLEETERLVPEVALTAHELLIIKNSANLGFSTAVNIGAARTTSEYLFVLNPDCYLHSHTVASLLQQFLECDNAGMVGALVFNEDGTEQSGCRRNEPTLKRSAVKALGLSKQFEGVDMVYQPLPDKAMRVDAVSGSAMLFHRRCFDEIGGMDEGYFLHCEDLDVCRRMRDAGYGVYFLPRVSLFHRQGVSGGTSNHRVEKLKYQGMMRYYMTHYANGSFLAMVVVRLLVWGHFLLKQTIRNLRAIVSRESKDNDPVEESLVVHDLPGPDHPPLLMVSGGNSDVGDFFISSMVAQNRWCLLPFRKSKGRKQGKGILWLSDTYFTKAPRADLPIIKEWVHLAPIWSAGGFSSAFGAHFPANVVALSSTSVEVKAGSDDTAEQRVVRQLEQGEAALIKMVEENASQLVILRPTLIYGGPRNRNINLVKHIVSKLRVFPIVGNGTGKRQPVHAQDVARACEQALNTELDRKCYTIAGNEVLSFSAMVERVFDSKNLPPRFIRLPPGVAVLILKLLRIVPGFKDLSPRMVERLQKDLVFSNQAAQQDFGYSPRKFRP